MQAAMLLRASPAPLARPLLAASRASAAGGARLRASPLALPALRCRRRVAVAHAPRAAASAAGGAPAAGSPDDPFKVLGVNPIAGADEFARARSRKLALAKGDEAKVAEVEAAYEAIMMRQLAQRMKGQITGGLKVSKDLAYADKWDYVPWRPRKAGVKQRELLINVALLCVLASWSVLAPMPGLQPMTMGLVAFFFRQNAKMVDLFPSPPDREAAKMHEVKRMGRTIGLVLGSIAVGIVLVTALPIFVSRTFALPMPLWVLTRQEALVNVATCLCMFITATYFR